jgi:dihydrofolate synthase/folylpolyglutamate synthase
MYSGLYDELLSYGNLARFGYRDSRAELEKSLKRTRAFLDALGSPDRDLTLIHVTGTSGKGSVCFAIHQILQASGKSVFTYLSPHTTSFSERFLLNDGLASEEVITEAMREMIDLYKTFFKSNSPLSFFELVSCLGLVIAKKAGATHAVIEVGLGGRYDATNVIRTPEVAVITNIDKDHTDVLGNSLKKIAFEKAGIIKKDGVVICGEARPGLKSIFKKEAIEKSAALFFIPPSTPSPEISESARHRAHNASLALRAVLELGIDETVARTALQSARRLPCRFETVSDSPLIILDGAHSPAKMKTTAETIKSLGMPVHILFAAAQNKDVKDMLAPLTEVAETISTTRFSLRERPVHHPVELLKLVPEALRGDAFLSPFDGLAKLREKQKEAKGRFAIVVTGSLFLAGELRNLWYPEAEIRKQATSFPRTTL